MINYLKGIYYALLGRVVPADYSCMPQDAEPKDADEFFDEIELEYSDVLEVLAA